MKKIIVFKGLLLNTWNQQLGWTKKVLYPIVLILSLNTVTTLNAASITSEEAITRALINAVIQGDEKEVNKILEEGKNVNDQDERGRNALHWAAFEGRINLIKVLLDAGVRVEALCCDGRTALHWATMDTRCKTDTVQALITAGVDASVKDSFGKTALDLARVMKHLEVVELLEHLTTTKN